MRTFLALIASLAVCLAHVSHADELDEWCAQVKKASSVVICSDPELRAQAVFRNRLFETARLKLGLEEYQALTREQTSWVKAYTARCGVPLDGPPPPIPVSPSVIACYRKESSARSTHLAARLSVPMPPGSMAAAPASATPTPRASDEKPGDKALREIVTEAWSKCLYDATAAFANQPEPARTVVDAAFGACGKEQVAVAQLPGLGSLFVDKLKQDVMTQKLLAHLPRGKGAHAEAGQH
jgi:uncharacterized protein YecT (DUF1311 family)